jgi:DNA-binding GntR family transcriptional regulator
MAQEMRGRTLKNKVYRELRRSIIVGRRAPGSKINIQQIAEDYGTSITPIREALQMLNQEGLVTIKPHSGYLVTRLTLKQLRDLLELREILELAAVEKAALRIIDEAQIEELERVHTGYTGDDDAAYERYTEENRRFHCAVAQATGNRELAEAVRGLHDRLARFMVLCHAGQTMQRTHGRIVAALRARDAGAARQAMQDELSAAHEVILDRVIQEQGDAWHVGDQTP